MEFMIGTSDQQMLGYAFSKEGDTFKLEPLSFNSHAHRNLVRTIASNDKFLVTGSIDETMVIYNLRTRSQVGTRCQHNGLVTCMEFYKNQLFSGSEDGAISIWDTRTWTCLNTLHGAKDAILDLSVHHSGKLAVSISRDKTLCMWNLMRGRPAYVSNIKAVPEFVKFSPDGRYFILAINNKLDVYCLETAMVEHFIKFEAKICCATYISNDIVTIGGEKDSIGIYNVTEKMKFGRISTRQTKRIKALVTFDYPFRNDDTKSKSSLLCLASLSIEGCLEIWSIKLLNKSLKIVPLASVETHSRASTLTAWLPSPFSGGIKESSEEEFRKFEHNNTPSSSVNKKRKAQPFDTEETIEDATKLKKLKFATSD